MLPTVLQTKTFSPAATCPLAKSPLVEPRREIVPFPHSTSNTHLTLSAFTTCPLVAGNDSSGMPGSRLISSSAGGPSQEWSASTPDFPPLLRRRLQTTAAPPSRTTIGRTVFPECRLSILCSTQNARLATSASRISILPRLKRLPWASWATHRALLTARAVPATGSRPFRAEKFQPHGKMARLIANG